MSLYVGASSLEIRLSSERSAHALLHVDVALQREVGDRRLGLGHPPRDRLLHARERDGRRLALGRRHVLACAALRRGVRAASAACRRGRRRLPARPGAATHVGPNDPPAWAAAAQRGESSTPLSRAIPRAIGEALTRPPCAPAARGGGVASLRPLWRAIRRRFSQGRSRRRRDGRRWRAGGLARARAAATSSFAGRGRRRRLADARDQLPDGQRVALAGDGLQRPRPDLTL